VERDHQPSLDELAEQGAVILGDDDALLGQAAAEQGKGFGGQVVSMGGSLPGRRMSVKAEPWGRHFGSPNQILKNP